MWQIVGHTRATTLLQQSMKNGQLSHAYLLVGPPHVGKFTLAVNLAQAVNCESEAAPCQQCTSCRRIAAFKHTDLHIIELASPEKKEVGIRQIAEMQSAAHLPPFEGKYKVFIFDQAEMLSNEAANSLLKILEEPPPNTLILLLTAKESSLLPTIASRCQLVELRPLPLDLVKNTLIREHQVSQEKADLLSRLSAGCIGWALLALRDPVLLAQREQRLADFDNLCSATIRDRLNYAADLAAQFGKGRDKVAEVLSAWLQWWHDVLLIKCSNGKWIVNIDQEAALCRQAEKYTAGSITDFMQHIRASGEQLDRNANPRLALEVLMLRMP